MSKVMEKYSFFPPTLVDWCYIGVGLYYCLNGVKAGKLCASSKYVTDSSIQRVIFLIARQAFEAFHIARCPFT